MAPKRGLTFQGNPNSQYDPGQIVKEVHDYFGQSIRTLDSRSVVPNYYTHFTVDYDTDNRPTNVVYWHGLKPQVTEFTAVPSSSLGGKYFLLSSAPDNKRWKVWFNVDGISPEPVVADTKSVEISLVSGDPSSVVALAIAQTLNLLYSDYFTVTRTNSYVVIRTLGLGLVDASDSATSGLTFVQNSGEQEKVSSVVIDYTTDGDPVYEGETLKGYSYDIYSGKFIKDQQGKSQIVDGEGDELAINPDGSINVVVSDVAGTNLEIYYSDVSGVVQGVTTLIGTYTAVANDNLQKIDFSGTNIAEYELVIDGATKAKKRTYFGASLDGAFEFNGRGLPLTAGQVVEIYVVHNRPSVGDFNATINILET